MHVRCPHCHNRLELVDDAPLQEILCSSCGSSFNLVDRERWTTIDYKDGRRIGHFELIQQLGIGAFGSVWKARDSQLDREVALKVPRNEQLDPAEAERFVREARAVAQLRHPSIVQVHEVGRDGDQLYIVSDLIQGATLADWLTCQRLTPRKAAELCITLADALHHAHKAGVVHRDLKPSNIMLDMDGKPYILDFGLAKRDAGEITMTVDGRILGTPAYMSPEQARGEGHDADARSDIYSLGVILFQLLTGELPFRGNSRMLLVQIQSEEPPSPRKLSPEVPRDLETITLKCLEKSRDRRYQTAHELADELRRFIQGKPIHARPVTRIERVWRWSKRNPVVASLGGVAGLLVVGILTVSAAAYLQTRHAASVASAQTKRIEEAQAAKAEQERQAHAALVENSMSRGEEAEERGDPFEATVWFAHAASIAQDPAVVQINREHLARVLPTYPRPIGAVRLEGGDCQELIFHASGKYLMARTKRRMLIFDLGLESPVRLPGSSDPRAAAWNPKGDRIAIAGERSVSVYSFPELDLADELDVEGPVERLAYAPDGKRLAIAGKGMRLWNAEKREFASDEIPHATPVLQLVFDDLGSQLATVCADKTVRVYALDRVAAPALKVGPAAHEIWSPDEREILPLFVDSGKVLATLASRGKIRLWDTSTGKSWSGTLDLESDIYCLGRSASGRSFGVGVNGGGKKWTFVNSALHDRGYSIANGIIAEFISAPDNELFLTASSGEISFDGTSFWPTFPAVSLQDEATPQRAAFSRDALSYATCQRGGLLQIWSRPLDAAQKSGPDRPFPSIMQQLSADVISTIATADLPQLAQIASCRQLTDQTSIAVLEGAAWFELWQKFRIRYPDFSHRLLEDSDVIAWRRHRLTEAQKNQGWTTVQFHLSQLQAMGALDRDQHLSLAGVLVNLNRIEEAIVAYQEWAASAPSDVDLPEPILDLMSQVCEAIGVALGESDTRKAESREWLERATKLLVRIIQSEKTVTKDTWPRLAFCQRKLGTVAFEKDLPPDWNDLAPDAGSPAVDTALATQIEAASGILTDRFAICQSMPLTDFATVCDRLKSSAYRPIRFRPYFTGERILVAAVWTRDALDWRMAYDLSSDEIRSRDGQERRNGYIAIDFAGYNPDGDKQLKFAAIWRRKQNPEEESSLFAGTNEQVDSTRKENAADGFTSKSYHIFVHTDGFVVHCGIYAKPALSRWWFASRLLGTTENRDANKLTQIDVSVAGGRMVGPVTPADRAERNLQAAKAAYQSAPTNHTLYYRALSLSQAGKPTEALADLDQVLAVTPNMIDAVSLRALLHARLKHPDQAVADVELYRAMEKDEGLAAITAAIVSAHLGDDAKALDQLEKMIERHPHNNTLLYNAACAYSQSAAAVPERAEQYASRAVKLLQDALNHGFNDIGNMQSDYDLWPIQSRSDFRALLTNERAMRRIRQFSGVWEDVPNRVSFTLYNLSTSQHLERARELAAAGYRPVSISVSPALGADPFTAASVWHRPTTVIRASGGDGLFCW